MLGSYAAPSPHTSPMLSQLPAPLDGTSAHVPSVAVPDREHRPPQHSASLTHASPIPVQNDGELLHVPSLQYSEQHSPCVVHEFPAVRHAAFSGVHAPSLHTPEQHSPSSSQSWLSEVH